jgi:hypothetical protein
MVFEIVCPKAMTDQTRANTLGRVVVKLGSVARVGSNLSGQISIDNPWCTGFPFKTLTCMPSIRVTIQSVCDRACFQLIVKIHVKTLLISIK